MNIPDEAVIVVTEKQYSLQKHAGNGTIMVTCVPCQRRCIIKLKELPVYKRRTIIACSRCNTPILGYGPYYGGEST